MRTPIYLLLLFLGLAILAGCSKKKNYPKTTTTISGYVTDVVTDDSLPNIKLRLRADSRGGSTQLKSFEQVLDSTWSDSTGYYEFTFTCTPDVPYGHEAYVNYGVEHMKEHYFKNPNMYVNTFDCGFNDPNLGNTNIIPLAWIKVHIKNEAPARASDSIYYNGPLDRGSIHSLDQEYHAHRVLASGAEIDTSFFVTIKANGVPLHYWDVTENGITTRSAAYVGCNPLDTCELNIIY